MTIKRRDFLRMGSFITVSAATLGVTGCSLDDSNDDKSAPMPPSASGSDWRFPQSVASGDPKPDSIILWTRVTPDEDAFITGQVTRSTSIRLRVTADANLVGSSSALQGTFVTDTMVPAFSDFDGTVRHKITKLEASKTYYYQFSAGDKHSNIGQFKTAPASTSADPVKFAFMSCQDWNSNHWAAFEDIADNHSNLDFVVHLGDYIYETSKFSPSATEAVHTALTLPRGEVMKKEDGSNDPNGGKFAAFPEDYRYLYKKYRSDLRIQKMHERLAMIATWDDHEFSDDCWGDAETYTNLNQHQKARRRAANQSWYEFMPADVSFSKNNPSFQNIRIYRDLKFGSVMHLVMTDERLYRADHLIPETTPHPLTGMQLGRINSRYLAPEASLKSAEQQKGPQGLGAFMADGDNYKLVSVLGRTQREWWQNTMKSSQAKWKIWGNEVSLLRMGLNGTNAIGTLVALQAVRDTPATMTAALTEPTVGALPKVAAGAGAAIQAGAGSTVAGMASFAILQTYAATHDQALAIGAGMAAGLTQQQATDALTAIGAKVPSTAEVAICATTVVAATTVYMTTGMSKADATTAAASTVIGLLLTDAAAAGNAPDANLLVVAKGTILTAATADVAGGLIVNVYKAAKGQAASGQNAQVGAAATAFAAGNIAFGLISSEVITHKTASSFAAASGQGALMAAFMRKFLINADQWDGFGAERKQLMKFLREEAIDNVVALTGDIHAFFAGHVYEDFDGEVKSITAAGDENESYVVPNTTHPVMVDLVTAGISSSSWFTYLGEAAAQLSALLVTLVSFKLTAAETGLPVDVELPVLDFTMGKPFSVAALTTMVSDSFKKALAANGIPEAAFTQGFNTSNNTNLTPAQAIAAVAAQIAGSTALQGLCGALALLNSNPWLKHIDTDAQGYAVVTATTTGLTCTFKRMNKLFVIGGQGMAPGIFAGIPALPVPDTRTNVAREVQVTLTADDPTKALNVS